jgi:ABC-type transport system involved in cytochrome bd biosynthesis fused ATPase/permease subunit
MLARTLLKKFNILIIDEGLNQVDINLERKILKEVFKKYKNKTIIVISHRLDNLDLFDNLIEIEKGVVVKNEIRG